MIRAINQPKLSIITIVLNGEKYLEPCIKSVLEQRSDSVEYIIVDGGSTDGTPDIIKKYEHQINRNVSEKDEGIADAYNKGISMAYGEIIGFINADDRLAPNAIKYILQSFEADDDILYGDMIQINKNETSIRISARHNLLNRKMSLNFPSTFIRKSVFGNLGLFNTDYKIAMDYEFLLRCLMANLKFRHCEQVLALRSYGGVSDKNWIQGLKEVRKAKDSQLGKKLNHAIALWRTAAATWISLELSNSFLAPWLNRYWRKFAKVKRTSGTS